MAFRFGHTTSSKRDAQNGGGDRSRRSKKTTGGTAVTGTKTTASSKPSSATSARITTATTSTIQDNIVRVQTFNHVSDKYDIIDLIGQGSMGSIYKIQIKPHRLGGSAFYAREREPIPIPQQEYSSSSLTSRLKDRFSIQRRKSRTTSNRSTSSNHPSRPYSINNINNTNSNSNSNSSNDNYMYALKTIRMDVVMDDDAMITTFLDEMVHEMTLLRSMDHPNIIKVYEIFMTIPPPPPPNAVVQQRPWWSSRQPPPTTTTRRNNTTKQGTTTTTMTTMTTTTKTNHGKNDYSELLQHQHMCLALELCTGGNLYAWASASASSHDSSHREICAVHILRQIIQAVHYMQTHCQIVHRDLKYENIVLVQTPSAMPHTTTTNCSEVILPMIKIIDFGLAKKFGNDKSNTTGSGLGKMYDPVGTIYTMAPEILNSCQTDPPQPYTAQVDVWSIGVIAYMLLSKTGTTKPFHHRDKNIMMELIEAGIVNYNDWDKSELAKDFVQHLLVVNPQQRFTIQQALQHPLLQQQPRTKTVSLPPSPPQSNTDDVTPSTPPLPPQSSSSPSLSSSHLRTQHQTYKNIERSMHHYSQQDLFTKIALTIIAHNYSTSTTTSTTTTSQSNDNNNNNNHSSSIDQLQKAFQQFDTEQDGILSYDEFKTAIVQTMAQSSSSSSSSSQQQQVHEQYTEEELQLLFTSLDINQNGKIMYTEFLAATIEACGRIEDDRLAEAFDRLDSDDTGYISEENLREILGTMCTDLEIKEIVAKSDKDNDGKISYSDFLHAFRENECRYVPTREN